MSEATKDPPSSQEGKNVTGDHEESLSSEEAEHIASQFKPAWEFDTEESSSPKNELDKPDAVADRQTVSDETQPPRVLLFPKEQTESTEDSEQAQGPIDIIANIPKRTNVQIKDEPSVVVANDPSESADSTCAVPVQEQQASPETTSRNKKLVAGAIAAAAIILIIAGLKTMLSDEKSTTQVPSATSSESIITSVEALPTLTQDTIAEVPTAVPEELPSEAVPPSVAIQEPEPVPEPTPVAAPKPVIKAESTPTTAKPPAKPAEPAPVSTPTVPKTAEPKPPKTTTPPATTKPPSGGIVRDTPF